MAIQLRVRKQGAGFTGSIVCVIRGNRIWSESSGIVRTNREDAKSDAAWLKAQQESATSGLFK